MPPRFEIEHRGEIRRLGRLGAADGRAHASADGKAEPRFAKRIEQEPRNGVHSPASDGLAVPPSGTRRGIHSEADVNAERQNNPAAELSGRPASDNRVGTKFRVGPHRLLLGADRGGSDQREQGRCS